MLSNTITISEAARRAGFSANALRYWIDRGHVEVVATPLGRVVVQKSLEAFLQHRADVARDEADKVIASR